jgi:hypothetical protein
MDFNPRWGDAIASIESGGESSPYTAITPNPGGRRALGKYQVMEENVPEWTQAALGRSLSTQDFLNSPDAQEAVFKHRFGSYVDKYGTPQDAASAWFTGRPINAQSAAAHDSLGTTGASYVDKFNRHLAANGDGVSAINAAAGVPSDGPGALTTAFAPTEKTSMPALSADSTLGPGALNPDAPKTGIFGLPTISDNGYDALMGMASSLAGISDPDHAKALIAQQAAMKKTATDQGTWSIHTFPNGQSVLMNTKGQMKPLQGNYAAPEKDPREQEAAKLEMKRAGDRYEQITTADRSSDDQLAKLDKFEQAVRNLPSTAFGPGADAITTAKALAAQAGFDVKGLTDAQIVQRMATQMQLDKGKMLPGAISNYEDQLMSRANGFGLDKQKDANLDAIASQRAILQHQKAAAQEAYKYAKSNQYGVLDDKWEPYISDWNAKHGVQLPAAPTIAAPAAPSTALSPGAYVWTPKGLQKK